jgi:hypothetical protein
VQSSTVLPLIVHPTTVIIASFSLPIVVIVLFAVISPTIG